MTQQYIAGELSFLLGQMQAAMTDEASVVELERLRRRAETGPRSALASVALRALRVADWACWNSLKRGDSAAFICQAAVCADLQELGVCAGLLEDTPAMSRRLVIVAHTNRVEYEILRETFSYDTRVQVILDRRVRPDRRLSRKRVAAERRRADRRTCPGVDRQLQSYGRATVTLDDVPWAC